MVSLNLNVSEAQVVEWIRQLTPEAKRSILLELVPHLDRWETLSAEGDIRAREACKIRGVDWESLSEEDRLRFVDDVLHES